MHLHYDKQLEFKNGPSPSSPEKFAPVGYENYEIRPTIGMQEPRSIIGLNCNFQTRSLKGQVKAGLYAQNSHYLVELKTALVQDKEHKQLPIALLNS